MSASSVKRKFRRASSNDRFWPIADLEKTPERPRTLKVRFRPTPAGQVGSGEWQVCNKCGSTQSYPLRPKSAKEFFHNLSGEYDIEGAQIFNHVAF